LSLWFGGSDTQCFSGGKPVLDICTVSTFISFSDDHPKDSVMSPPLPSSFLPVSMEEEDSTILLGCPEPGLSDNALEHLLPPLSRSSTEVPSSINIPTYFGELHSSTYKPFGRDSWFFEKRDGSRE
jgi:hypothetical protein